jgi:hypothetical protein
MNSRYRDHFDHLGQLRSGDFSPWTASDLALVMVGVLALIAVVL